jgi:thymidylate synthase
MRNDMDVEWLSMVSEILTYGERVEPRGTVTKELEAHQIVVDMTRPVLTIKERKLGYRFMAAEAAWMLDGRQDVAGIAPFSKQIANFSDDGKYFFGAYGPKLHAQRWHVIKELKEDLFSRRAVANIWRENPMKTKDYPCHLSCQFLVREGALNCYVAMRSSDAWLGVPYDIFNFSMWSAYILLCLGDKSLKLGCLYNTAASRHLYQSEWLGADRCLEGFQERAFTYEPFNPWEFATPEGLVGHLWQVANSQPRFHAWLKELP